MDGDRWWFSVGIAANIIYILKALISAYQGLGCSNRGLSAQ